MPACPAQDADGVKGPGSLGWGSIRTLSFRAPPGCQQVSVLAVARTGRYVTWLTRRCGHPAAAPASALAWPDQIERPVGRPWSRGDAADLAGDPGIGAGAAGDREGIPGRGERDRHLDVDLAAMEHIGGVAQGHRRGGLRARDVGLARLGP